MVKLQPRAWAVVLAVVSNGCGLVVGLGPPSTLRRDDDAGEDDVDAGSIQASAISVSATHGCAVIQDPVNPQSDGTLLCWGSDANGELGQPPQMTPMAPTAPVASQGGRLLSGLTAVLTADAATCAITPDGYLYCWGALSGLEPSAINLEGADAFVPSLLELSTSPLLDVASPSLGAGGGCVTTGASSPSPSVICWGKTLSTRQVGDAGQPLYYSYVSGAAPSVGESHACVVTSDGTDVACWGDNTHGQAGPSPSGSIAFPTPVGLASQGRQVAKVVAGGNHSCALTSDGVYCWGQNDRGQAGDPNVSGDTGTPTRVQLTGSDTAADLALGENHACALMNDATVQCWGDNSSGQLGVAQATPMSATPVTVQRACSTAANCPAAGVQALPNVGVVAAGGNTACTIRRSDTRLWCWGQNDVGQAGQPAGAPVFLAMPMTW